MLVAKLDPIYEKQVITHARDLHCLLSVRSLLINQYLFLQEEVHVNAARALVDVVVKCPPSASSVKSPRVPLLAC